MRKSLFILLSISVALQLLAVEVDYRLSGRAGWIMPDGKVDKMTNQQGKWIAPAIGADFSATFHPHWLALQQWNGAGVGLGFTYWHLPHDLLGQAFAPYTYMDIPLVKSQHFVLGLRPGIGAAFMTKTYQNTVAEKDLYNNLNNANQSIGSVTNLYFPEMLYMDFPIAKGWAVGISGGWYHISNGSLRQPNSGYNLFAAELALRYSPTQSPIAKRQSPIANTQSPIANTQSPIAKKWSLIVSATASGRQVYYRDQQTFFVGSMHAAAYWHAHPIFHLGGGVDVFYDGAYIQRDTYFQKTNLAVA
ncbi:MAG: acyloxyacyl hydrolase, partial [Paludibacteraceae bacterium]|nr:acyloxyacyl hydrolase [Paludibacteraceae bacterium]